MTHEPVSVPTCPIFKLLAIAEDEASNTFSNIVEFLDIYGKTRRLSISRSDFDEVKAVTSALKNAGAFFSASAAVNDAAMQTLVTSVASAPRWKYAASTGWRHNGRQFVLPRAVIGTGEPSVRVRPPSARPAAKPTRVGKRGTLAKWKSNVAKPARRSSRLVFAICTAFAAPLIRFANLNSFGVQLSGPPKIGKSTALLAGASVIGFHRERDLPNFRVTDAALGEIPAEHNDSMLPLNELALLKGRKSERIRDLAYGLSEGTGTAYSKFVAPGKATLQWRTIAVATGEESAEQIAESDGTVRMGGEAVRWIDLPAIRKGQATIFDFIPANVALQDHVKWSARTCVKLRVAIRKNHGVAIRKFIKAAIKHPNLAAELKSHSQSFAAQVSRKSDSPTTKHLARSFAHIYASGILAVQLGILPWTKNVVLKCLKQCYRDSRRAMRTPQDLQRGGLRILRKKLDGDTLVTLGKRKPPAKSIRKAEGFVITVGNGQKITVRAEKFKAWFSDRRQPRLVLDWLLDNGAIMPGGGRKTATGTGIVWAESQPTWPDGTRARSIVLDLSLSVRNSLPK
jgi:hypothetical protein